MFTNTLPIIFSSSQLIGPLEFFIIFSTLFGIIFISAPFPEADWEMPDVKSFSLYHYLLAIWNGALGLNKLFWPFFIVFNAGLYGADALVQSGMISVSSWSNIHVMMLGPVIWWTLGVWRGSSHSNSRLWIALARLMVVSAYIEYVMRFYISKALPRLFFNCEELLMDYFQCF